MIIAKIFFTNFIYFMKTDKISFTSKINFVNTKTFNNFRHGSYIDYRKEFKLNDLEQSLRIGIVNADEFYTDEIRTCTAGGIIDTKNGKCAGFHIYDNLENEQNLKSIFKFIFNLVPNPDKALILGSKKLTFSNHSIPIFKTIFDELSTKIKNITSFEEHTFPFSESNIHYSLKDDIWTINSMYKERTSIIEKDILTEEDLKKCFKNIKLDNKDTIFFKE